MWKHDHLHACMQLELKDVAYINSHGIVAITIYLPPHFSQLAICKHRLVLQPEQLYSAPWHIGKHAASPTYQCGANYSHCKCNLISYTNLAVDQKAGRPLCV